MKLLLVLFFSSFISNASGETVSTKTIRIMSYNIKALGLRRYARDNRFEKLADAINGLGENKPEILLVQEGLNRKLDIFFKKLNYPYYAEGPGRLIRPLSSGLHILSKYPIIETQGEIFNDAAMADSLIKKGVQFARIRVPGMSVDIDVYNTHMQAAKGPRRMLGRATRIEIFKSQLNEIHYLINRTSKLKNILFFGGDVNIREQEFPDLYKTIFTNSLERAVDIARLCQEDAFRCNYNIDMSWQRKIDYLFYREPINANIQIETLSMEDLFKAPNGQFQLSDHAALMGTFVVSEIR